jgi:hypothetical protein
MAVKEEPHGAFLGFTGQGFLLGGRRPHARYGHAIEPYTGSDEDIEVYVNYHIVQATIKDIDNLSGMEVSLHR